MISRWETSNHHSVTWSGPTSTNAMHVTVIFSLSTLAEKELFLKKHAIFFAHSWSQKFRLDIKRKFGSYETEIIEILLKN